MSGLVPPAWHDLRSWHNQHHSSCNSTKSNQGQDQSTLFCAMPHSNWNVAWHRIEHRFQYKKIATLSFPFNVPKQWAKRGKRMIALIYKCTFFQLPCINVRFVEVGDPAGVKLLIRLLLSMWVTSWGQKSCTIKKKKKQELYLDKAADKIKSGRTIKGIKCQKDKCVSLRKVHDVANLLQIQYWISTVYIILIVKHL